MDVIIKKLSVSEIDKNVIEEIMRLEETCGENAYSKEMLEKILENTKMVTFVASCQEKIIGMIMLNPYTKKFPNSTYIINLIVLPSYQGLGIAKRLIYRACCEVSTNSYFLLEVDKENPAQKLYEAIGFYVIDSAITSSNEEFMVAEYKLLRETLSRLIQSERNSIIQITK